MEMVRRSEDPELQRLRLLFGREIRVARIKAGLSQAQLAERIGRSQRYVSSLETGGLRLPLETMMVIMRALGFTVEIRIRPLGDASRD